MSMSPFWGDVGDKKCHPIRALKVPFFCTQKWALLPKVPIFRCPKMGLRAPVSKNGDHFFTPTSPQNGGIDICFMRLPLLEEKSAKFEKVHLICGSNLKIPILSIFGQGTPHTHSTLKLHMQRVHCTLYSHAELDRWKINWCWHPLVWLRTPKLALVSLNIDFSCKTKHTWNI